MNLSQLFINKQLYETALTHASYAHLHGLESNEKLEYIGDRVVNLIVSTLLLKKYPHLKEGELAVIQSYCCATKALSTIALSLGLDQLIKLEPSEVKNGGQQNPRNLENLVEAIFGALYLDQGFEKTLALGEEVFASCISASATYDKDAKSRLQEYSQKVLDQLPVYEIIQKTGPSHAPEFEIQVSIVGLGSYTGKGKSKKEAEMIAAQEFLKQLGIE